MTFLNIMTIAFSWQCNVRKCFGKQSRDGDGPDGASGAQGVTSAWPLVATLAISTPSTHLSMYV